MEKVVILSLNYFIFSFLFSLGNLPVKYIYGRLKYDIDQLAKNIFEVFNSLNFNNGKYTAVF